MVVHPRITGVVLAGGRAARMGGSNKALLSIGSATTLEQILAVFAGRFAGCVVVAPDPLPFMGLPVTVTSDQFTGCGPLGGVHAGLAAVKTDFAFVCGCDMPSLSGPLVEFMASNVRDGRLLVPIRRGRPEPLHALYPVSCLPEVEQAIEEGVRMMLDFFARAPVDYLSEEEYRGIEGAEASFFNINTPEDLEAARRFTPDPRSS
jgi:molybdopterin-guanine dinucleotide biosynthesis protein A